MTVEAVPWLVQGRSGAKPKSVPGRTVVTRSKDQVMFLDVHDPAPIIKVPRVRKPGKRYTLDLNKMYLDSCCTFHNVFSTNCVENISKSNKTLVSNCNAGETSSTREGYYGRFHVWVNTNGMANLLSIPCLVREGYRVGYETGGTWTVTIPEGTIIPFEKDIGVTEGIPFIDTRRCKKEGLCLIETVRKNFKGYSKKEIEKAVLSKTTQAMVGHPPTARFKQIVSDSHLAECPVDVNDVSRSVVIFGPDRSRLRGAATRQNPKRVVEEYMKMPRDFYQLHKFVTLSADVMFVNGIPFLITFSRNIRLITAEHVPTRTARQLAKSLMNIVELYGRGGFLVRLVLMDMEFEKIKDKVALLDPGVDHGQYALVKRTQFTEKHLIDARLSSQQSLFERDDVVVASEDSFPTSSSSATGPHTNKSSVQLKIVAGALQWQARLLQHQQ